MKKIILMLLAFMPMAMMAQNAKFGHLDTQSIMQSMPDFIKARGEIEAEQKQYENELQEMQKELQTKAEKYEKEKATMNATTQQQTEQSLQEMYQKIQQAIEAVGKEGGFSLIQEMAPQLTFYHAAPVQDITATVKAKLGLK